MNKQFAGLVVPLGTGEGRMPTLAASLGIDTPVLNRRLVLVGNVAFDDVTMEEALEAITIMARQTDRPRYVCTGNLDHLAILRDDEEFRRVYNEADMVLADGMPVVWLSGRHGEGRLRERVAGSDMFWELCGISVKTGLRLFYMGGATGAADEAARKMREQYPGVQIVGTYCPSFDLFQTEEEQTRILEAVHAAKPDILLVGLGAPKQEKWIYHNLHKLNVPVSVGVGGTFEMAAGMVNRAPRWMQQSGTEWLYRLGQEPHRLWKRYIFRDLPHFFHLLLGKKTAPPKN